ncbi:Muskelin N-terminus-domain-containing protein [Cristinia sonorae]|uniref:Muskelin N-terminus-domain-containing protein n=1 Tax=Cristinia sonorae TaxID=1940300 RepID=A0A8K0XUL8_9AGAR|nr:Muskelin N-terminus-domain-containing protein [Cristinia sonorae]
MPQCQSLPLTYTIAGCSEHSGRYVAENILVDNPMDQGSRWSGAYQASNIKQWMLLKLDTLCILRTLTFGKVRVLTQKKAHPCNMKEFKLFVGETEESMIEVLHAGLRNDHVAETFSIRHVNNAGVPFPTRYVKIVPLSAHGQSFHTSIWHVRMTGIIDHQIVQQARTEHEQYKETMIMRHILKHLRQRRLLSPFHSILSRTGLGEGSTSVAFEHPIISSLYQSLVMRGQFSAAELSLSDCATAGLFSSSVLSFQPTAAWLRMNLPNQGNKDTAQPSARGGHSMCFDQESGLIYMFGGWDGKKSLQDFWVWNIRDSSWKFLGSNGPGPRTCHKIVFDKQTGDIYLFGNLDENSPSEYSPSPTSGRPSAGDRATSVEPPTLATGPQRGSVEASNAPNASQETPASIPRAEFYRYRTRGPRSGEWELITADTMQNGGPPLVFDHQMVMDNESRTIYFSGGRVVDGDWDTAKYSGLYSYNVDTDAWKLLQPIDQVGVHPSIPARFGHSMVYDNRSKTLFILGGQRDDKYLADMYAYHVPTNSITELYSNFAAADGPDACFTQRAVVDPELKEIYVFCGLTKGPPGSIGVLEIEAPYWVYRYERPERPGVWTRIISPHQPQVPPPAAAHIGDVPLPRFAHQVVYDTRSKTVYLHGGNAGLRDVTAPPGEDVSMDTGNSELRIDTEGVDDDDREAAGDRLDDFWSMQLQRPSSAEIVRRAKYLIRQQRFREMCEDSTPVSALAYLQTEVSSVVDHADPEEAQVFRSLLSHLLTPRSVQPEPTSNHVGPDASHAPKEQPKTPAPGLDEDDPMEDAILVEAPGSEAADEGTSQSVVSLQRDVEVETLGDGLSSPSPERYKQRTEIFEKLMKFVNEDARQPDQNLWDMIDVDHLREAQ